MHLNEITFKIIDRVDDQLIEKAAILHFNLLSYRSFLTLFGVNFIKEIYKDILRENNGFLVFAMNNNEVIGFVIGCIDSQKLNKIIYKRPIKYFNFILPVLVKKPVILLKIFETFFYDKKENININAELIAIAIDNNFQGMGIGTRLNDYLNEEFIKRKIDAYKVTVHDEMKLSNSFYIKNNMKLKRKFKMYGIMWNLYIKKIS